jgi:hypothetical protein
MIPEKKPRAGKPFSSEAGILEINCKKYANERGITVHDTVHFQPDLKFILPDIYIFFGQKMSKKGVEWLFSQKDHYFARIKDFEHFKSIIDKLSK